MCAVFAVACLAPAGLATARGHHHSLNIGVVSIDAPSGKDFGRMHRGKVGVDRFLVYWPNVQASAGGCTAQGDSACDWTAIDQIVSRAASHHVPLLPFLYGTPGWASNRSGPQAARFDPMLTLKGRKGWRAFVTAAVQRYGTGGVFWSQHPGIPSEPIRRWQVWNEQNSSNSFKPHPSAKAYAKLLNATATRIRKAEPKAQIFLGGMFGTPGGGGSPAQSAWRFLAQLYSAGGAKRSFDAVALHPYSRNVAGIRYQLDKTRHVIAKHGDGSTPIWITELGWGSDAKHVSNPLVKTPKGQKKLLHKSFRMLRRNRGRWHLGGVTWFSWRDPSPAGFSCEFCRSTGLFTLHGKAKPAWRAYTGFTGGRP